MDKTYVLIYTMLVKFVFILTPGRPLLETDALPHAVVIVRALKKCGGGVNLVVAF